MSVRRKKIHEVKARVASALTEAGFAGVLISDMTMTQTYGDFEGPPLISCHVEIALTREEECKMDKVIQAVEDAEYISLAIAQAYSASSSEGGIPIGAAIVRCGQLVSAGVNRRVQDNSQVLHAGMRAIEMAGPGDYREATMYTTLMPCWMCSGALVQFGFSRVVVGEAETFDPGTTPFLEEHGIEVVILDLERCKEMMREFIEKSPELWAQDIGGESKL